LAKDHKGYGSADRCKIGVFFIRTKHQWSVK